MYTREFRRAVTCNRNVLPMAWPIPKHSNADINRAGKTLADSASTGQEFRDAHEILTHWRACHGYPLNTFQSTLRNKLKRLRLSALVAQRLKRTPSIISKLKRFDKMQLARMQDIGGLRAVVPTIANVRTLCDDYKSSRFKHELSEKDYISNPKADGYRSIHMVFKYNNNTPYDGLSVELQIRTKLQHAWATAVETMGTFLGQALKSSQGDKKWLEFFKITGSAFAYLEESAIAHDGLDKLRKMEAFQHVLRSENELGVLQKLRVFRAAVDVIGERRGAYYLLTLDSAKRTTFLTAFSQNNFQQALDEYANAELRTANGELVEAVLVSAGPIADLKKAYPNYFLDTADFIDQVAHIIKTATRS